MNLIVNGKAANYSEDCRTVADLLSLPEWNRRLVIVELNGEIVAKEHHGAYLLNEGDRIEVVHFVGGG
ncbi:thiamine biosynthesis protein ThiS [Paenibacillus sp. FSL R7-0273]|uniref:sulfur carrier protein ThiS n=1 Tax=Paenibacillus sp. FSL R7-0273 TaxID=1536772 RepID=UPI0004F72D0A|nr:sulfur carrier protein ThiS [Paenibacillus sp. FSL R7-0273]AIQ46283.1 thiamine biosynthesis protein ThiS [Paenibacillus sp. FSL R7-0273]OMF89391.1 thiamine biosynthesis protein ThiS [Paenibacillus sp. FSL R7-0273]